MPEPEKSLRILLSPDFLSEYLNMFIKMFSACVYNRQYEQLMKLCMDEKGGSWYQDRKDDTGSIWRNIYHREYMWKNLIRAESRWKV